MAGETILIVDAGQDINQRMIASLEGEGYLVYPVSSQEVNAEMAELLGPSLIYIKPSDLSPTGLDSCKAIHGIPLLIKVPIVILASLKKALGPEYLEEYGIVDYLDPTFRTEDLIEKTGRILGKMPPSRHPKEDKRAASPRTGRRAEKQRPALLRPAIGIIILLMIVGTGYMAYQHFMPAPKVPPSPAIKAPVRVPSVAPKGGLKPQLPPVSHAVDPSAPASSVPSSASAQPSLSSSESKPQPLHRPFYSVQLGAFRDEERAQALTKKFTQPGVMKDKTPIYRVLVSKYEDRNAAKKMAGEIQSKEQIETTLYGER